MFQDIIITLTKLINLINQSHHVSGHYYYTYE